MLVKVGVEIIPQFVHILKPHVGIAIIKVLSFSKY